MSSPGSPSRPRIADLIEQQRTQTALETGHDHAARAEGYERSREYEAAAEWARKASESYARAAEGVRVADASVKATMIKLQEEWARRAKDLQRKADHASRQGSRSSSLSRGQSTSRERTGPHSQEISATDQNHPNGSEVRGNVPSRGRAGGGEVADSQTTSTSMTLIPPGESFLMLSSTDPQDPFNQFWTILQGMLENLSAPVAWATVPLNGEAPSAEHLSTSLTPSIPSTAARATQAAMSGAAVSASSASSADSEGVRTVTPKERGGGTVTPKEKKAGVNGTKVKETKGRAVVPNSDESETFSDSGDDFFVVAPYFSKPSPSASRSPGRTSNLPILSSPLGGSSTPTHSYPPSRPKTLEELHYENISLKQSLSALSTQVEHLAKVLREKEEVERVNVRRLRESVAGVMDVRMRMQGSLLAGVGVGGAGVGNGVSAGTPRAAGGSPKAGAVGKFRSGAEGETEAGKAAPKVGGGGRPLPQVPGQPLLPVPQVPVRAPGGESTSAKEGDEQHAKEKKDSAEREKKREEELDQIRKKLAEMEAEITRLRIEGEKDKADLRKYRDRWEKVKETAKKKKEAKAASGSALATSNLSSLSLATTTTTANGGTAGTPRASASRSGGVEVHAPREALLPGA